ncbi:MAG TPA: sugar phosphate isomerase/epimerase family protein [Candidatus Glassbacteria bacterium]|nr:sugar phosphate isomerase/epimerase family protein [Candidatus Glassbacteria bacterium]
MSAGKLTDLSKLCIHTITTRPWNIEQALENYAGAGVAGITVWRQWLEGRKPEVVGRLARESGLEVVSVARGGFFPAPTEAGRQAAVEDNRRAIDEAAGLGAPILVLVCGAAPGQSIADNLAQISEGIEALLPQAEQCGVRLGIEPLHPLYADTRSAIVKMKTANDVCEAIGSPWLGITVDVYHVWWDPDLEAEIERAAGSGRLFSFHICDWKTPLEDLLNDRGLMGEGIADVRGIRGLMEKHGFRGFNEVEIFSNRWWAANQHVFLGKIIEAYLEHS